MSEVRAEEIPAEERGEETVEELIPQQLGIGALAHDAVIYGGTRVALKSLAFLLVPLYAHFLTRSQFGVLELILAATAFIDSFIDLSGTLARFYFDRDEPGWRRQAITLFLAIESIYPLFLLGGLIIASRPIADLVLGNPAYAALLVIALCDLYLTNIVDVPLALCRLRRKPWTFAGYTAARAVPQILLSVLLVAVLHMRVKGILIASLSAACIIFVVTAREYVHDLTRRVDWSVGREMISFSWPTIVSALSFYALNLLDRFFVRHYHGLADNGLYGVGFRYSQIVLVGVFAFRMGWPQWHYSWLHSGRHQQMVARGANYYFLGIGFLTVLVSAWILPLFHLIMPERYWAGTRAVAPLSLAALGTGAYMVAGVGLNVTKRMRLIPPTALAGGAIAIGLYFLLIPPYSYVGAAWATAASFGALGLIVAAVSQRIYPIPWDFRRLVPAIGLTVGLSVASLGVDAWMPLGASLPVRVAITLAFPAILLAVGFFTPSDRAAFRRLVLRGR